MNNMTPTLSAIIEEKACKDTNMIPALRPSIAVLHCFRAFDHNNDGSISWDELKAALHALDLYTVVENQLELDQGSSVKTVDAWLEAMDKDKDGKVNLSEWKEACDEKIREGITCALEHRGLIEVRQMGLITVTVQNVDACKNLPQGPEFQEAKGIKETGIVPDASSSEEENDADDD